MNAAVRDLCLQVWPPKHREVTWKNLVPPLLFLLVFGVLVMVLEARDIIRFSNRMVFLLVALAPWIWWQHHQGYSGLTRFRGALALTIRLVVFGALLMLLAGPRAVRKNDDLSVMYALDLSDSMSTEVVDEAIRYLLETAGGKKEEDRVGLVLFGRDAAVELPPQQSFPFEAINSQLSKDGTNLEKALSLAAAVIPEDQPGRIVLISDGTATEGQSEGIVNQLRGREIPVDVLPVSMNLEKEAWLERIDLPVAVKVGESYEANVLLTAIHEGRGTLLVQENGEDIYREEIDFVAGKNRITLPIYLRQAGYYEYTARLLMADGEDGWEGNNVAVNDLYLRGEGKTLLVTDPDGDPRDWESLQRALVESQRVVEVKDAYSFPRTAISLMPYDSVVFVNVAADAFDTVQLQAVEDAVYNQGMGFLMVGGENSFGPGGYHRTPIEDSLPVSMDIKQKKVLPKGALAIILHTCEFAEGNTWGKRIAKQAIKVLGAEDEVGVIDYERGKEQWVFPLTKAGRYDQLVMKINMAMPGDMPAFAPPMQIGLDALSTSDAAMRHMIIISDGDPIAPPPRMIQDYVDNKISVSTIGINPHGPNDVAILESIAETTGGRYYFADDPSALPSIFIKEAKTLKRSMIQNKTFAPRVEFPSPVLKGIDAIPELLGYVLTSAKPRSHTILRGPEEEEINPVLSVWRYGTGSAAAFTSDLAPKWGKSWVSWAKYRAFVSQLLTEISRGQTESELQVQVTSAGNVGIITVEDHHKDSGFLEMEARLMGPERKEETVTLDQVAPRRYRAEFPLWGTGRYQVMVAAAGANRSDKEVAGLSVAYSPEYLQLHSDSKSLETIAASTGGRVLNGQETELFDFKRTSKETSQSVIDWFLLLIACLVPVDVGLRRVHLDWSVMGAWFKRAKKEESGSTMSALLRRKEKVDQKHRENREPLEVPSQPAARSAPAMKPRPSLKQENAEPDSDEGSMSTTERLLALKRRREQDRED